MIEQKVKQVIILRKDLKMRLGKSIAQGAHASLMCYKQADHTTDEFKEWDDSLNGFRKITLSVNSEDELLEIVELATKAKLNVALVKDLGLTEFKEPTYTSACIGPHYDEDIDPITSKLSLL